MGRVNVEAARNVGSEPCLTLSGRMQGNRAPDPTGAVGPKFGTSALARPFLQRIDEHQCVAAQLRAVCENILRYWLKGEFWMIATARCTPGQLW